MKHRIWAAAALAVTAALTLTACGSKNDDKAGAKDEPSAVAPSADEGEPGEEEADDKPQDKGDACAPSDMKVEAGSRSGKVLLVATNTGKKPCTAYGFPYVRFDQDQATAAAGEETKPKAPVKVAPGKSAYAAVTPTAPDGSGGPGRDAHKLSLTFQSPNGDPLQGDPSTPALPTGTLHVDDQAKATYWLPDEAAALKG
ncbi:MULTISPECIES: DUF4232 domain-containing protein [Actinomycetes]|uniref:DUF4232 domain-containing protein n=1 Tax=Streptomyces nondiastaticus TaxID=3154512 RepID=A0ABW6TY30_9ACTN|nr:DUF4232 domain-containing protein [Streptosporangium nondiastaticum]